MSVIPASHLSGTDMASLGNNLRPTVLSDRLQLQAINGSLAAHGEQVAKLFSRRRRPVRLVLRSRKLDA